MIIQARLTLLYNLVHVFSAASVTVMGVASNIADALRQARELRPDVILVDIMLGRESGFDLARRLAEAESGGGRTVILISTHAEADFADLIEQAPAAGFLPKSQVSASMSRQLAG